MTFERNFSLFIRQPTLTAGNHPHLLLSPKRLEPSRRSEAVDENYTLLDYIQMARLEYALGELEYKTTNDTEKVIRHFRTALQHLEKGGFDLSISKWTELVSLRTKEDTE